MQKRIRVSILQALLVLSGLVETIVAVGTAPSADELNRLLGVASALGEEEGSPLGSLSGRVHHIMDLLLRPPRLVPHLLR